MNRKHFLSTILTSAAFLPGGAGGAPTREISGEASGVSAGTSGAAPAPASLTIPGPSAIVPPCLRRGDTIGITSPAGYITLPELQPAIALMQGWGFNCRVGETIGKRDAGFGGTDEERAADMQKMLDDPAVKAIMCARGGYGSVRIIDKLDFTRFKEKPKWIIGFSDITVLHCHINRNYGIASIHSKMCNSFPDNWSRAEPAQQDTILSIRQALTGTAMQYTTPAHSFNRHGKGTGALVGGNLKTIESLAGSASDLRTTNKLLFVEDTGEYLYSIDRMFWNLKRTGKLDALSGLIIGGFRIKPDDPGEAFGRDLYEIVMEKVREYDYPVCFNFPVGHQRDNFALKYGITHSLEVRENGSHLGVGE